MFERLCTPRASNGAFTWDGFVFFNLLTKKKWNDVDKVVHLELTRQSLNPHKVRALFKVTVTRQQFEVFEFCEITGKESINAVETIWDSKQYAQYRWLDAKANIKRFLYF